MKRRKKTEPGGLLSFVYTKERYAICEFIPPFSRGKGQWIPVDKLTKQILSFYFGVDLTEVNRKKRALVRYIESTSKSLRKKMKKEEERREEYRRRK